MAARAGAKFMWFAAGVAVGATAAVLFTPASGPEIRRKIAEKADQGRTALSEQGKDIYERGRRMIERGRHLANEAAEMFEIGRRLIDGIAGIDSDLDSAEA
jgi:gas vesicle protein